MVASDDDDNILTNITMIGRGGVVVPRENIATSVGGYSVRR